MRITKSGNIDKRGKFIRTIEMNKKMSESLKRNPPFGGKHHTKKSKQKMSRNRKGKRCSIKTEFKKGMIPWNKGKKGLLKHSKETREKIGLFHKGNKNVNWKGGISSENEKIKGSIEYRLWRESVFARDNWICQKCGKRGVLLNPHHILSFSKYPELRTSIENGITLCQKCHIEFHKKYGRKNNTKEQLIEFLNICQP